ATSRRQVNNWFGATPCRRAPRLTVIPETSPPGLPSYPRRAPQAYRHTRLEGLFDHANLLRGRPAPTTLNRRDDLNAIGRIVSWRPCPGSSGAISIGAAGTATDRTKVGLPLRDRRRKRPLAAGATPRI